MKKLSALFIISLFVISSVKSQTLIAKWTFPTGAQTDSIADGSIAENSASAIKTLGGTSAVDFSKNGLTTKAAQATGWDNGNGTKYWQIKISTLGYETLELSSKQQTGGNNPGPKDFKVQYKIDDDGIWTDVSGTSIVTANDWTTGALNNISLPAECYNQSSLYIRWIMTSDLNSAGGTLASNGISKIDDIYIYGIETGIGIKNIESANKINIYPNPAKDNIYIDGAERNSNINIYDLKGRLVNSSIINDNKTIQTKGIKEGLYLLQINNNANTHKIVISNR